MEYISQIWKLLEDRGNISNDQLVRAFNFDLVSKDLKVDLPDAGTKLEQLIKDLVINYLITNNLQEKGMFSNLDEK